MTIRTLFDTRSSGAADAALKVAVVATPRSGANGLDVTEEKPKLEVRTMNVESGNGLKRAFSGFSIHRSNF
jgi:hypothetical protein